MNGRPPRTISATLTVLQAHPEMQGKPCEVARFLALNEPSFSTLTGKAVVLALTRLRRKVGTTDTEQLCWDGTHVGRIVSSGTELVCSQCGRSFGFTQSGAGLETQQSVSNGLWRAYDAKAMVYPRKEGMISKAAVTESIYGKGVKARMVEQGVSYLANLCKGETTLSQERTAELTRLTEKELVARARFLRKLSGEEVRMAVIAALRQAIVRDPMFTAAYSRMIDMATTLPLMGTKVTKGPKPSLLDEEEAVERGLDRDERRRPVEMLLGSENS